MSFESGRRTAEQSASGPGPDDAALAAAAEQVLDGALADDGAFWSELRGESGGSGDGAVPSPAGSPDRPGATAAAVTAPASVAASADAPASAAGKEAETKAYEDAVKKAFGGRGGMADAGLPSLLFLIVFTATKNLGPALWASIAMAAVLTVLRLLRKETLQHAMSGLFGVLVCAALAKWTGRPENYYLPGLLINAGYCAALLVSVLVRWPMVGLMLGPITGEMTMWRKVPGRMKAFTTATWIMVGLFALKLVVQVPLWMTHHTTELGIARAVMGYPLYLAALYFCWQVIKAAPPPVKPVVAEEDGEAEA